MSEYQETGDLKCHLIVPSYSYTFERCKQTVQIARKHVSLLRHDTVPGPAADEHLRHADQGRLFRRHYQYWLCSCTAYPAFSNSIGRVPSPDEASTGFMGMSKKLHAFLGKSSDRAAGGILISGARIQLYCFFKPRNFRDVPFSRSPGSRASDCRPDGLQPKEPERCPGVSANAVHYPGGCILLFADREIFGLPR